MLRRVIDDLSPTKQFHSYNYIRHNQRRQEHLATLGLDLSGASVLEVGAGIGDHTEFFLDRGCTVIATEGRPRNVTILAARFQNRPQVQVRRLDMESPGTQADMVDIVYCYGLLYHLAKPSEAIQFMAQSCKRLLLLETCVSFGNDLAVNLVREDQFSPSQATSGSGCRPTRPWVFAELKKHFPHVYMPKTQPNHEEFPIDWTAPNEHHGLTRAVFIASRAPLVNPLLVETIMDHQTRH